MTQILDLDNSSRLLIVVPHPDDETLATGGLIQKALAAGAILRVVIVTDGDDNPWPQRWIEKRWHIDSKARQRWGGRRREEATAALARLGVAEQDVRHYGWPDQGLTERLMQDAFCEGLLVAEIEEFAPTLVVAPSLSDLHPDHNALRVMLELAMGRTSFDHSLRLGFVVHGPLVNGESLAVPANDEHAQKKHFALQAHASQLVLSGRRMNEICRRVERFEFSAEPPSAAAGARPFEWRMADSRPAIQLHARALYLIIKIGARVIRTSLSLPRRGECLKLEIEPKNEDSVSVQVTNFRGNLQVKLSSERAVDQVFAKIERLGPRIFIYDASGWQRID